MPLYVPLASTTPAALGTAAVGTGSKAARSDHVHPASSAAWTALTPTFIGSTSSGGGGAYFLSGKHLWFHAQVTPGGTLSGTFGINLGISGLVAVANQICQAYYDVSGTGNPRRVCVGLVDNGSGINIGRIANQSVNIGIGSTTEAWVAGSSDFRVTGCIEVV